MHNDIRKAQNTALPSEPIEITGLTGLPKAGDMVLSVKNERKARDIAQQRQTIARLTTEGVEKKYLKIILKADVHGSLEAIRGSIAKANHQTDAEVHIELVDSNVGGITSSDIMRAKTAIIGIFDR